MKKIIFGLLVLVNLQANAVVSSLTPVSLVSYLYIAGSVGISLEIGCRSGKFAKEFCDEPFHPSLGRHGGILAWMAFAVLEGDEARPTFPELDSALIGSIGLSQSEVDSYNNDLTSLRMSIEHLGNSANIKTKADLAPLVEHIDRTLEANFSDLTMSAVQKIRAYNASSINERNE
jgi:hypothetical protein